MRTVLFSVLLVVGSLTPNLSWAYRPFIATDAAVADPKEVEIELGYFTLDRENGQNSFVIPRVVFNYGLFQNWEAVAEFAVLRASNTDLNLIDPALSLKAVLKEGVLQEKEGVSVAVEVGLLLPSTVQRDHVGFEGDGIASGRLGPFTFHLNGGLGIQRSNGNVYGIWGLIGECPIAGGFRLVGELDGDKVQRQEVGGSGLLGFIWQPWSSQSVAFDAGVRRRFSGAGPTWEFTFGVTFAFSPTSVGQRLISVNEGHSAITETVGH